jgi:hypothetical protein
MQARREGQEMVEGLLVGTLTLRSTITTNILLAVSRLCKVKQKQVCVFGFLYTDSKIGGN